MNTFSRKRIIKTIENSEISSVYLSYDEKNERNCIVKILKKRNSSLVDIARFLHEYNIIKTIDHNGIIRVFDCIDEKNEIAIVQEYFHGSPLKDILSDIRQDIKSFLTVAIRLAETLGYLHQKNIIHKDIKPRNFLVSNDKSKTKIFNFGICRTITHQNDEIYDPKVIDETLVYMSPEQTGRMNRTVDYRSDLYSLGITFYEMITGDVPFRSNDPMEIIHAHIAQRPVPPIEKSKSIPVAISDIIMKLLVKNPEERYQSAYGLMIDLQECLNQYNFKGHITPFEIASNDISIKFNLPQKFFGRENEIKKIMDSFERVSVTGKSEMTFVSGNPGIGKSALINEINKAIIKKRGFFISGKFDQFRKDVPYSALLYAFTGLVRQLLTESRKRLEGWKGILTKTLGTNGRVITEMLPDMELIIGKQPEVPVLGPDESTHRFMMVFTNFVRIFARKEHPMVIFLDDLQWADLASLTLIKKIMLDDKTKYIYFIGAYRGNETSDFHPLSLMMHEIAKENIPLDRIELGPLNISDVNRLTSSFLRSEEEATLPLAELIQKKTSGNPFFINQFLKTLYDEKILNITDMGKLTFSGGNRGGWSWDIDKITKMRVTDNVVEFMTECIWRLPIDTREILKFAACVGNRFDLETLSLLMKKPIDMTLRDLTTAVDEGLVVIQGQAYSFYHDRIQEAAYSLIPSDKKAMMHWTIGKLLLHETVRNDLQDKIMYIVNQLNAGLSCISDEEERYELAGLNLQAALKAKSSAAYRSALQYINTGLSLICPRNEASSSNLNTCKSAWEKSYEMTLSLYSEKVENSYLCAEYEEMDYYAQIVLANAKNILDKSQVYEALIHKYLAQNMLSEAIATGMEALKYINIKLPKKPSIIHLIIGLVKTKLVTIGKKPEDAYNLPQLKDKDILLKLRLLYDCGGPIYWGKPELFPFLIFKGISILLKHGNCSFSPSLYVIYGTMLCATGDIEKGYNFGKMAQKLAEKLNARDQKSRITYAFYTFIHYWKEHIKESLPGFLEGYKAVQETGDLEFVVYNLMGYCAYGYLIGKELTMHEKETKTYSIVADSLKQKTHSQHIKLYHQIMLNLMDESGDPLMFKGKAFDEEIMLPQHTAAGDHNALIHYHLNKSILCYLFWEHQSAFEHSVYCEKNIESLFGQLGVIYHYYFHALTCMALYQGSTSGKKSRYLRKAIRYSRKLRKCASYAPMNFLHKYELVLAEIEKNKGHNAKAMELYNKAITNSRKNEYTNDEALANELAAKFYLSLGYDDAAIAYINKSYEAYSRWGARAKLLHLREQFSSLIKKSTIESYGGETYAPSEKTSAIMDLMTVLKASKMLSYEIHLGKFLEKMLDLAMENAGAERGIFAMEKDGRLHVEAEGTAGGVIRVMASEPLEDDERENSRPITILNYVNKSGDNIVIDDAMKDTRFGTDPYITKNRVKSVICIPVRDRGKTEGILYLENNMTSGAFTPGRIEILNMLSSQAAISLQNAILYDNLARETKIREKAEEARINALRERAEIIECMGDALIVFDLTGMVIDVNPYFIKMTGLKWEDIIGKHGAEIIKKILKPEEWESALNIFRNAIIGKFTTIDHVTLLSNDGREIPVNFTPAFDTKINNDDSKPIASYEISWDKKDGSTQYAIISPRARYDENGNFAGSFAIITDITDRKKSEMLEKELISTGEKERQKIGHDLHDDLGPHLIGIEVLSTVLKQKLETRSFPETSELETIRKLIREAISKTRNLARGLCPVYLVDHGLESAIQELARTTGEVYRIACDFNYNEPVNIDDISASTHIYHIAHEAVHNAVKHGRAKSISISMSVEGSKARLRISDDGKGMDKKATFEGMGLKIMNYRASVIGAVLSINSELGKGTAVEIIFNNKNSGVTND